MITKLFKYSYIPVIIYLIILYLCCFIPLSDVPDVEIELFIPMDKLVHFCMYFGLSGATAFNYIFLTKGDINKTKLFIWAYLLPILYGGFIELIQHYYFPPREGDWFDFLADALGSIASLPFVFRFRKYILKKYSV